MKIEGMNGAMHNVTSQGQGTLNTILGGIGTLGVLGGNNGGCGNGGILGGILGGNNCSNDCHVSQTELAYATALASCKAERYADQIARVESERIFLEARRSDDKIASVVKDTTGALIETGVAVAGLTQQVKCLQIEVDRNRSEAKTYTDTRVDFEAELRKAADQNVLAYTNSELCKKIDGTLRLDGDDICYNRCKPVLEQCGCLGTPSNPINVELVAQQAAIAAVKAMAAK